MLFLGFRFRGTIDHLLRGGDDPGIDKLLVVGDLEKRLAADQAVLSMNDPREGDHLITIEH